MMLPKPTEAASADLDARLNALEVKLGFVDDLLDALNRTVFRQQEQIDQLAQAITALRQQALAGGPGAAADARDEIPPHY
jgi:SlyX protein